MHGAERLEEIVRAREDVVDSGCACLHQQSGCDAVARGHPREVERLFDVIGIPLPRSQTGCLLRVSSEPLAYEGLVFHAWKVLPVSGMLELSGVLIFATNLILTFLAGRSAFALNISSQKAAV